MQHMALQNHSSLPRPRGMFHRVVHHTKRQFKQVTTLILKKTILLGKYDIS